MVAYLKGEIIEISGDNLIIEVNKIGYNVRISPGVAAQLPRTGSEIKIHTYTYVKEDAFQLFGFLSKNDLEIFRKVITVAGVGPKSGMSLLSVMDADSLSFAILAGDVKQISKTPGIGHKTAERIILELRDKMEPEVIQAFVTDPLREGGAEHDESSMKEAIEALMSLGYSSGAATKAVKRVENAELMGVEAILKAALGLISE